MARSAPIVSRLVGAPTVATAQPKAGAPKWLLLLGVAGVGAGVFFYMRKRKAKR